MRNKEILRIQSRITNATTELQELGYEIEIKYLCGAGIVCELRNVADEQAKIDAEQEKNNDYAIDNMTSDDYDNAETWEELDKFDNSNYEDSDETVVIDDVGQMYDPTERLKMEEK